MFVDDSPTNVEAAASVGMDAIAFTTPVQLARELALRGLPVPTPAELGEPRT